MRIQKNIKLAPYTNFKIGGQAKYFCNPKNTEELIASLEFAKNANLKTFILGTGSNILVSDKGFSGLVIKPENKKITIKKNSKNFYNFNYIEPGSIGDYDNFEDNTKKTNARILEFKIPTKYSLTTFSEAIN